MKSFLALSRSQIREFPLSFPKPDRMTEPFTEIMTRECTDASRIAAELERLRALEEYATSEYGLSWKSQARTAMKEAGEDEFTGRFGIAWDILENGYLESRRIASNAKRQRQYVQLTSALAMEEEQFLCRQGTLAALFGIMQHDRLRQSTAALEKIVSLLRRQVLAKKVAPGSFYTVLEQLTALDRRLESLSRQADPLQSIGVSNLPDTIPVYDLELDSLVAAMQVHDPYPEAFELQQEIIRSRYARIYDIDLEFFSDVGVDNDQGTDAEGEFRLGMSLRIPLQRYPRDYVDSELEKEKVSLLRARETAMLKLTKHYQEYQELLARAVQLQVRFEMARDRLRRALLLASRPELSLLDNPDLSRQTAQAAERLAELIELENQALRTGQRITLKLLTIFTEAGLEIHPKFLSAIPDKKRISIRPGDRAVYIWSDTFARLEPAFMLEYLNAKQVERVLLASGTSRSDPEKFHRFIEMARVRGMQVEPMASANVWVRPKNRNRALERIADLLTITGQVHLDIEPHALPGFKENKQQYLEWFRDLLRSMSALRKEGRTVSVSLSPRLDAEYVTSIQDLVDRVFVMAYGVKNPVKMIERLAPFSGVPPEKLAVALRPKDFADEQELEQFIRFLVLDLGIEMIALHDLGQYLALEGAAL